MTASLHSIFSVLCNAMSVPLFPARTVAILLRYTSWAAALLRDAHLLVDLGGFRISKIFWATGVEICSFFFPCVFCAPCLSYLLNYHVLILQFEAKQALIVFSLFPCSFLKLVTAKDVFWESV
jgi:hypothetical protein